MYSVANQMSQGSCLSLRCDEMWSFWTQWWVFFCLKFLDWYCHFGLSQCETYRNLNTRLDAGNGLCGADDQCYCYRGYSGNTCLDASYTDYSSCGYRCTFDQGLCEVSVTWIWEVDTLKFWVTAWFWTSSWKITRLNFQAPHAFKWYLIRRDHCFRGVFAGTHLQQYWRSHPPNEDLNIPQRPSWSKSNGAKHRRKSLEIYAVGLATVAQNIVVANAHAFLAQTDADLQHPQKQQTKKKPMDLVISSLPLIQGCTVLSHPCKFLSDFSVKPFYIE